jgi:hypothetical protein
MNNRMKSTLVFNLFLALGILFSQCILGQEKIIANETDLIVTDDIFGGDYQYLSGNTIQSDRIVSGNAHVTYSACNLIKLTRGFKVERNSYFKASTKDCGKILAELANDNLKAMDKPTLQEVSGKVSFDIYPNVTDGIFYVDCAGYKKDEIPDLRIYNSSGTLVYTNADLSLGITEISLTGIPQGIYILKAETTQKVFLERVILK